MKTFLGGSSLWFDTGRYLKVGHQKKTSVITETNKKDKVYVSSNSYVFKICWLVVVQFFVLLLPHLERKLLRFDHCNGKLLPCIIIRNTAGVAISYFAPFAASYYLLHSCHLVCNVCTDSSSGSGSTIHEAALLIGLCCDQLHSYNCCSIPHNS